MRSRKSELKRTIEELTRRNILDAAATLLKKESLSGLTMDKVAEVAGFAKGTLYLYFKNKKTLLNSLVDLFFEPLEDSYREIVESDLAPLEKIEQSIGASARFAEEQKEILLTLGDYVFRSTRQEIVDKSSWYWEFIDQFGMVIENAVKQGTIRPVNGRKVAAYLLGAINVMISHRVVSDESEPIEENIRDCTDIFLNGLVLAKLN